MTLKSSHVENITSCVSYTQITVLSTLSIFIVNTKLKNTYSFRDYIITRDEYLLRKCTKCPLSK